MKKSLAFSIAILALLSCTKIDKTVSLSGELVNFPQELLLREESPVGVLLSKAHNIVLDDSNQFAITFELNEPSYFRLGRNALYLTPGDKLEVFCDYKDPETAVFSGDGETACSYLKSKPFPKSGSYLNGGSMIKDKPPLEEIRNIVASEVERRTRQLDGLDDISPEFRVLEEARIKFDAANTLLSFPNYSRPYRTTNDEATKVDYLEYFANDIMTYIQDSGKPTYLQLDVFRKISSDIISMLGSENVDREIIEYLEAEKLLNILSRTGPLEEVLEYKEEVLSEISMEEYKSIINSAFQNYESLLPGNIAPDITMTSDKGDETSITVFRDKVIVLDIWATWCGPCRRESPLFEEYASKYEGNNIEFISLSVDTDKKAWQDYLDNHEKNTKHFITNRTSLSPWKVSGIPRFIIINEKGLILDAFAPAPSNPKFEQLILEALSNS